MNNIRDDYITDEALEELIASVESKPLMHPPKGFRDDIISQIRRKRKYKKNFQLFSYSMKVIAATAASLGIVLIVPDNISNEESTRPGIISELRDEIAGGHNQFVQEKKSYDEKIIYKLNKHMDEYVSAVNGKLNEFVRMEVNFNEKEEK